MEQKIRNIKSKWNKFILTGTARTLAIFAIILIIHILNAPPQGIYEALTERQEFYFTLREITMPVVEATLVAIVVEYHHEHRRKNIWK